MNQVVVWFLPTTKDGPASLTLSNFLFFLFFFSVFREN